ncbi:MAG: tetratricopeptide repeat protein [Chromatiales bacterium]
MLRLILCAFFLLALSGCADALRRPDTAPAPESAPEEVELPFPEPEPVAVELSSDLLYSLLVAEVAAQRSDLERALGHYLYVAKTAGLAYAAERAARIARFTDDDERAREASSLWVELAPNALDARRFAAAQHLADGEPEQAMEQLEALILIADARGEEGFLEAAEVLSRAPDKEEGLALMRRLVDGHHGEPEARYALVVTALATQHFDEARDNARRVLQQRPEWHHVRVLLARILIQSGDTDGARKLLRDAVRSYPESEVLRTAYAQILMEQKDLGGAYEQFQALLERDGASEDIRFALGVLAVELERPEEARGYLGAVYREGARQDEAAYFLGRLEQEEGRSQEAIDWYRKVSGAEYRSEAGVALAELLAEAGRIDEAREVLQRLRVQAPGQSVWLYLEEADLLKENGEPEQVWALYDTALEAHPGNADLLYARAMYGAAEDRLDVLERDLGAILAEDPDHADALNALGYTLAERTDRYEEALGYIERALALKPDNGAILDSMGWVLYRLGRPGEALDFLRRALDADFDGEIAAHLGEVLWVTGEREAARKIWNEALERDPGNEYVVETMERLD